MIRVNSQIQKKTLLYNVLYIFTVADIMGVSVASVVGHPPAVAHPPVTGAFLVAVHPHSQVHKHWSWND